MLRFIQILLTALLCAVTVANGQLAGRSSAPDPFYLNYTQAPANSIVQVPASAAPRAQQTINPAIQNCILIGAGQSNSPGANVTPTAYVPSNASVLDYMNINDGAIYPAQNPMAGASWVNNAPPAGGAPILRLADNLVTAGKCARAIVMPMAIDATTIADWATGAYAARINTGILRLAARGIVPGANVTFVILWGQGESDTLAGTGALSYETSFATMKVNAGCSGCRWLVATQSYFGGIGQSAAVRTAQAAVRNGSDVFAGANADALVGNICVGSLACRQADGTHWTDAGGDSYDSDVTNGWQAALHASGAPF